MQDDLKQQGEWAIHTAQRQIFEAQMEQAMSDPLEVRIGVRVGVRVTVVEQVMSNPLEVQTLPSRAVLFVICQRELIRVASETRETTLRRKSPNNSMSQGTSTTEFVKPTYDAMDVYVPPGPKLNPNPNSNPDGQYVHRQSNKLTITGQSSDRGLRVCGRA